MFDIVVINNDASSGLESLLNRTNIDNRSKILGIKHHDIQSFNHVRMLCEKANISDLKLDSIYLLQVFICFIAMMAY